MLSHCVGNTIEDIHVSDTLVTSQFWITVKQIYIVSDYSVKPFFGMHKDKLNTTGEFQ